MSSKLKLPLIVGSLVAAGFLSARFYSNAQTPKSELTLRTLASLKSQSTLPMEKHLMPIQVSLVTPSEVPEGPDEAVVIKAKISTPFQNFKNVSYQWVLPPDCEIVSGSVSATIENPVPHEVYEIQITLKNFDKQYRKELTLKAMVENMIGEKLVNSAIITSRPEDSLEHLAPAKMIQAQEFAAKAKSRQPSSEGR